MSDNWMIRTKIGVEGPFPEERIDALVSRGQLGPLDEVSRDGKHWVRLWKSGFWTKSVSETPSCDVDDSSVVGHKSQPRQRPVVSGFPNQNRNSAKPKSRNETISESSRGTTINNPVGRTWQLQTFDEENAECPPDIPVRRRRQSLNGEFSIWRVLFGGVFKRHGEDELSAILNGTRRPVRGDGLPEAWLWSRILLVSIVLSGVLLYLSANNSLSLPGFFVVAAFGTPVAALAFFLECDVGGFVSGWKTGGFFLIGGIFSLLVTHLFNNTELAANLYGSMESAGAGPIEELAKTLILLGFVGRKKRYPYILDGLLIGAAIGAGFAAFETAGYIFQWFMAGLAENGFEGALEASIAIALLRGALAPFMHIAWTAAVGGAMWAARGTNGTFSDALFSWRTAGAILLAIVLHALWNAGLAGLWLSQVAWIPIVRLLRRGIHQCFEHENTSNQP